MDLSKIPTYQAGILQSKAYRSLKAFTAGLLEKHGLTMMQWYIIGLVFDAGKKGIKVSAISEQLDTTVAFVTGHVNLLESAGFVKRTTDKHDNRAKIVTLHALAHRKVKKIESELRSEMKKTLYGPIRPEELAVYIRVLDHIANLDN